MAREPPSGVLPDLETGTCPIFKVEVRSLAVHDVGLTGIGYQQRSDL